jgi:hypothetical protein
MRAWTASSSPMTSLVAWIPAATGEADALGEAGAQRDLAELLAGRADSTSNRSTFWASSSAQNEP